MWIVTGGRSEDEPAEFLSVVKHRDNDDLLIVRARDPESLKRLSKIAKDRVARTPDSDYPYRLWVTRAEFAQFMRERINALDYDNVKKRVKQTRGPEWEGALMSCWNVLHDLEPADARDR